MFPKTVRDLYLRGRVEVHGEKMIKMRLARQGDVASSVLQES